MSLLFSTETLFTNKSIELLTEQNDRNKKVIYELKIENTKLTKRIEELQSYKMSKTYSHSEVMDLIHKCKESERLIWREKLEEKNKRIEDLEHTMGAIFMTVCRITAPTEEKLEDKNKRIEDLEHAMGAIFMTVCRITAPTEEIHTTDT